MLTDVNRRKACFSDILTTEPWSPRFCYFVLDWLRYSYMLTFFSPVKNISWYITSRQRHVHVGATPWRMPAGKVITMILIIILIITLEKNECPHAGPFWLISSRSTVFTILFDISLHTFLDFIDERVHCRITVMKRTPCLSSIGGNKRQRIAKPMRWLALEDYHPQILFQKFPVSFVIQLWFHICGKVW